MNRFWNRCAAIGAGLMWTGLALAAQPQLNAPASPQADHSDRGTMAAYFEDDNSKKDDASSDTAPAKEEKKLDSASSSACGCSNSCSSPSCGCEASCSAPSSCSSDVSCCSTCGCDCCLGIENCWPFCCCCKPGDPWTLEKELTPCCKDVTYGGWFGMGTYTNNDPLSFRNNDHGSFWDHPNDLNLDQAWFWVEKKAKTDSCCWDWGYRADLLYGVDSQKTQAFGNPNGPFAGARGYDNGWDNGAAYGWALPQTYLEFANCEWDWKIGHFFTPLGYEVIPETGNFFYSHSYTMFNSEPFTHTGALGTYKASDKMLYYVGWTLGWDTGYDQFGNGSNFIGGFTYTESKCAKYTYLCTAGDLGWRGDGYSHSIVADYTLSKKWEYVFQSDLLDTDNTAAGGVGNLSYGVNNYLFYTINDCWKWGTRAEWWKSNSVGGTEMQSFYEVATGPNYKYNANLTIRPEMKFNWVPAETTVENTVGTQFDHAIFGIDALYTF